MTRRPEIVLIGAGFKPTTCTQNLHHTFFKAWQADQKDCESILNYSCPDFCDNRGIKPASRRNKAVLQLPNFSILKNIKRPVIWIFSSAKFPDKVTTIIKRLAAYCSYSPLPCSMMIAPGPKTIIEKTALNQET